MTIDTTKLRELAMKATPGPWTYFPYPKYKEHHVSLPIDGSGMTLPLFPDGCQTSRQREDAEYIAAANPATVLALLDEIKNSRAVLKSYGKVLVEISESLDIAPFHFTAPVAVERCKRLIAIEKAARNLAKVKGRHHSEQAYQKLVEVLG